MSLPEMYALKARWVFPVEGPPIERGIVVVEGEKLAAVGQGAPPAGCPLLDLGEAAILPGLVNAHVHLEYSDLHQPLGRPGMPLTEWLPLAMGSRGQPDRPPLAERVAAGLAESAAAGVTRLGEIATSVWDPPPLPAGHNSGGESSELVGGRIIVFYELIAPTTQRMAEPLEAADRHLAAAAASSTWRAGLSPHARHTACGPLLVATAELAAVHHLPLAIHLAESPEEIEWLESGRGPIAELLAMHGTPAEAAAPAGRSAGEVIERLRPAPQVLLVHGNYLNEAELRMIAAEPERLAVVYCPRTHTYFGHGPHPLERLLELGATVALGTDGRGSNPDLSLLAEMRHVRQKHPSVPASQVLELGTLAGARALGCHGQTGSLLAGKRADLCAVRLAEHSPADTSASPDRAADLVLRSDLPVVATIAGGRLVYSTARLREGEAES